MKSRLFFAVQASALLSAVLVFAPQASADESPRQKIHVEALETGESLDEFVGPDYEIHQPKTDTALPSPLIRDRAFAKAGLAGDVKHWDAVDLDVLFLRAKTSPVSRLIQEYPKLSRTKLKALKKAVGAP